MIKTKRIIVIAQVIIRLFSLAKFLPLNRPLFELLRKNFASCFGTEKIILNLMSKSFLIVMFGRISFADMIWLTFKYNL